MRSVGRPSFLHLKYYRYLEHVGVNEDFNQGYRDRQRIRDAGGRKTRSSCSARSFCSGATRTKSRVEAEIDRQVEESIKKAEAAPFSGAVELYEDVLGMSRMITYRDAPQRGDGRGDATRSVAYSSTASTSPTTSGFSTAPKAWSRSSAPRAASAPRLAEDAMTGFGLGAAINGMRPIHVHMRVDFLLLGMNQLVNMIATHRYGSGGAMKVPMVIRAIIGRGWGQSYQHSKSLHSWFAHVPGLKVVMPSTPRDAKGMLIAAIRDDNPVIFIEHRWLYDAVGEVPEDTGSIALDGRTGPARRQPTSRWSAPRG